MAVSDDIGITDVTVVVDSISFVELVEEEVVDEMAVDGVVDKMVVETEVVIEIGRATGRERE